MRVPNLATCTGPAVVALLTGACAVATTSTARVSDTLSVQRSQYASTYVRREAPPVLIRNATILTAAGPEMTHASVLFADGRIVAVRHGHLLATSFHPELTGDQRVHGLFVGLVKERS